MKPLTEYERWAIEEREWSGAAAEDERRIREAIAIDEAAFAAATARQEAWESRAFVDGDDERQDAAVIDGFDGQTRLRWA